MRVNRAIVVEGRDDVAAVSRAADALIIPTHGYGISRETWEVIDKAASEKGLIILTDPDHAGEQIRKRITEKYPDAVQAYIAREDATRADDIGVENADPETIRAALEKALKRADTGAGPQPCHPEDQLTCHPEEHPLCHPERSEVSHRATPDIRTLTELGLAGSDSSSELRAGVCRELGIGYGNAKAMIRKLRGFGIGTDELREAVEKVKKETR